MHVEAIVDVSYACDGHTLEFFVGCMNGLVDGCATSGESELNVFPDIG